MKLVKEISTEDYKIISDAELLNNSNLYIDRTNRPIYWELYGYKLSDSILVKDSIQSIYNANGWTSFKGIEEKKSVARVLAYTLTQIELDEVLTPQEQINAKLFAIANAKIGRVNRWEVLRQQLAVKVTQSQSLSFYSDTEIFKGKYIDVGLPHLYMWLTNGIYPPLGIDFTNNGFAETSYYTIEMKQICIDYLKTGVQFIN